jgi:hypothetical protein
MARLIGRRMTKEAAVNGAWHVPDADGGEGIVAFTDMGSLWRRRRGLARHFWSDGSPR